MNDIAKQATTRTKRKAVKSSLLTKRGLKSFCSTDPSRPELSVPWSHDGFTYATNGHILVRVARLSGVAALDDLHPHPPHAGRILEGIAAQRVTPLPAIEFPAPVIEFCPDCAGCAKCRKACETCGGTGEVQGSFPSLMFRGARFNPDYIKLITRLPDVEFSAKPPQLDAARFVFAGGEGALMPMKRDPAGDNDNAA